MVSAWAETNCLVLGQVATQEKSNEITAIPKLLETLYLQGCIVTIDAGGCQRKNASQIREQKGDYLLALKGNQSKLHEEVVAFFKMAASEGFQEFHSKYHEETDGGHGRVEIRRYWLVSDMGWLSCRGCWRDINFFGMVEAERHIGGKRSREKRFYISSMEADVKKFAKAVRGHWGIENRLHWCLDMAFDEDRCRVRKRHAPQNLAVVRHLVLNLLKQEKTCKRGIKTKRKMAGWSGDYLLKILNTVIN